MKHQYILFSSFLLLLLSCKKEFTSLTKTYELDHFDTLTLNSVFDVQLIQDTVNVIELTGAARILEKVTIENNNGHLKLKNTYRGKFLHPKNNKINIRLHTDGIRFIKANETCFIHNVTPLTGDEIGLVMAGKLNEANLVINCRTFYYWNNFPCGGRITLSGAVNSLKIWNYALMAIDAKGLICQHALVENSSKGDCWVNCLEQLTCAIRGNGHIYLWGNPPSVTITEQNSMGKLIKQ